MSSGVSEARVALPTATDSSEHDPRWGEQSASAAAFDAAAARAGIVAQLLPHQREGVLWMLHRERGARDSAHPAVRHLIRAAARAKSAAMEMEASAGRHAKGKGLRSSRPDRSRSQSERPLSPADDESKGAPRPGAPEERLLGSAFEGGVLGDDMGMGKTLQMLSLIALDASWCGLVYDAPSEECAALLGSAPREGEALKRAIAQARESRGTGTSVSTPFATLVVCPQSVLHTWGQEARRWLGWDSAPLEAPAVSLIRSSADALRGPSRGRGVARAGPCWHRSVLVIASYETIASDAARARSLANHAWRRVVLDEAHRLRNDPASCACLYDLRAARRWACTGTLFHNGFSDVGHVARFIGKMPYAQRCWWVQHQNNDEAIAAWRRDHLKMRAKDLLRLPPVRFETVDTPLSGVERSAYDALLRRALSLYAHFRQTCTNRDEVLSIVLNTLRQMRQFCNHPLLAIGKAEFERNLDIWEGTVTAQETAPPPRETLAVQRASPRGLRRSTHGGDRDSAADDKDREDETCPARRAAADEGAATAPALSPQPPGTSSSFLLDGIGTKCASARSTASMREHAHHVRTLYAEWRDTFGAEACERRRVPVMDALLRTKLRAVVHRAVDVLRGDASAKLVLFSQWTGTLRALRIGLRAHGVGAAEYHGKMTVDKREQQLRLFSQGQGETPCESERPGSRGGDTASAPASGAAVRVILVSLRAGGIGINLSCASHVFMVDGWYNPFLESQAIDRVNRLGQTHAEVVCVRFHVPMTVEDDVADIQCRKRRAASRFYGRGEGVPSEAAQQPLGPRYASLRETIGAVISRDGSEYKAEGAGGEGRQKSINMHQAFGEIARSVVAETSTSSPARRDATATATRTRDAGRVSVQISSSDAAMERGRRDAERRRSACAKEGVKLKQATFGQAGLCSSAVSIPQWAVVAAGGTCVSARGSISKLPTLAEQRAGAVRDGGRVHVDAGEREVGDAGESGGQQSDTEKKRHRSKRRRRLVCASSVSPIRAGDLPAGARITAAQVKQHRRAVKTDVDRHGEGRKRGRVASASTLPGPQRVLQSACATGSTV